MKTIALSCVLALMGPLVGQAQTQKGLWTVGTQVGDLSYQNQNGSRIISISITPSAGYFFTDGLVIGTGIPITTISQKTTDAGSVYNYNFNSSSVGLSPFIRYFLGEKKFKPYFGVAYSYSRTTYKSVRKEPGGSFESEGKGKVTAFVPTVGVAYFLGQNLGLTAGLNYNINHNDQEGTILVPGYAPGTSNINSDSKSLSLAIGFQLFIGK